MTDTPPAFTGEIHPYADAFPMLPDDDLDALADDIARNGQRHPIILSPDGALIDGRNRLEACRRAGVEPRFSVHDGDPVALIVSENMQRRDLTQAQKAHLAVAAISDSEIRGRSGQMTVLARVTGVSQSKIGEARTIAEYRPDLPQQVIAGTITHTDAYEQARQEKTDRQQREQQHTELKAKAPDLAAMLNEDFTLAMAWAAYEERHRKEREQEAEQVRARNQAVDAVDLAIDTLAAKAGMVDYVIAARIERLTDPAESVYANLGRHTAWTDGSIDEAIAALQKIKALRQEWDTE